MNEFPYNICEMIVECMYPGLQDNVICIIAMMEYHSGALFIELVHTMKQKNFLPKTVPDVEEFFKKEFANEYSLLLNEYDKKINSLIKKN